MKPAMKYAAITLLHDAFPDAIWEHEIFAVLDHCYSRSETSALREELVGLRTLGWIEPSEEQMFEGQILRKYELQPRYTAAVERQIDIPSISRFLAPHIATASAGGAA